MAIVHVTRPFTLTLADGSQQKFVAGPQEIAAELLNHWFVKAHLGEAPEGGDDLAAKLAAAEARVEELAAAAQAAHLRADAAEARILELEGQLAAAAQAAEALTAPAEQPAPAEAPADPAPQPVKKK